MTLREDMLRMDDLETQLDQMSKDKSVMEKQIEVQKNVIQELRHFRDNCVKLSEYVILKDNNNELSIKLTESEARVESLTKRVTTDLNEIEILHQKSYEQSDEIKNLKKDLKSCLFTIDEQNKIIKEINDIKKEREFYRNQYETTLTENQELTQLIEVYKSEDMNNDDNAGNVSNISIDDLNQTLTKLLDSIDYNDNEESFESVFDIKLLDIEKALEEKKRLNEELMAKTQQMNEEIAKLTKLRLDFEMYDKNYKEKQSFDRIFKLVEKRVLSYVPLNRYVVPISRRVLQSLTPLCIIRTVSNIYNN